MEKQISHGKIGTTEKRAALLTPVLRYKSLEVYSRLPQPPGDAATDVPPIASKWSHSNNEITRKNRVSKEVLGLGQQQRQKGSGQQHGYAARRGYGIRHGIGYKRKSTREKPKDAIPFWGKQNAPKTKRLQDSLDRETEIANLRSELLQAIDVANFPVVGYYLWYDQYSPPSKLLGEDLRMLDDIRAEFKVFIDYNDATHYIRLRSNNQLSIEDAMSGIKAKVQHIRAEAARPAPTFLIEPPPVAVMKTNIEPKFGHSKDDKQNLVVEKVLLAGSSLTPDQFATWEIERNVMLQANQSHFKEHIGKALTEIRALKSGMKMRVHLGHVQLLRFNTEFGNSEYSFDKFTSMMRQDYTVVKFEKSLGDASFAINVLELLKGATKFFVPLDSQADSLADIKPKHSLLILARISPTVTFGVEADINMLDGGRKSANRSSKDTRWKIAKPKYYKHDVRRTQFNLGSFGFESNFDWCLEMVSNEAESQPIFQRIITDCLSKAVLQKDSHFLNYPSIALRGLAGPDIDRAWMKSTLEYKLKGSPYIVEVSVYRVVETELPKKGHVTTCGITVRNTSWDLFMAPDNTVANQRDWSEENFFPSSSSSAEGFVDFAAKINEVQTCLDGISG